MSREYLRCPVCGKLSKPVNFQIHNIGGYHRFPDVMVQEIYSIGRGKIRNKWHSEKLDGKRRRELRKAFSKFLSQVLAGILADLDEEVGLVDEDELIQVIAEGKERKKKRKDETFEVKGEAEDEIFGVKGAEDEILDEIFKVKALVTS